MDHLGTIKRYYALKSIRDGQWLPVWREVRQYCYPTISDFKAEGGLRGETLFDTTAIEARSRLAGGIVNWMIPLGQRWFELQPEDDDLAKDDETKVFFAEDTKQIMYAMANKNWATAIITVANEIACGLDGVIFTEDGKRGLNFKTYPIESIVYACDSSGTVDTVFREISMTARQIMQDFGDEDGGSIPEKIRVAAAEAEKQDEVFKILHAVIPRTKRDSEMLDAKNMPFADLYIELESKQVIHEGGYHEMPYAICSYSKAANESYGRGPGMDKLPDIKMLNRMRQAYIVGGEIAADPPWLIPDGSLVSKNFNKGAGGVNFYNPGINNAKPEQVLSRANLTQSAADIEGERGGVRKGFHWELFDPLGDLRNITATEAEIRQAAAVIPFAPVAGNISTFLSTIIHRIFGVLSRQGVLPPPPAKLLEAPAYKIDFVSKMALALKKLEALGWMQSEAALGGIMGARPDLLDNFDLDEIARGVALVNGISPKWLVPAKKRDEVRAARADQQAAMQQAEMLAAGAQLAPGLAKAPEPGSPLDALMTGRGV